MKIDGESVSRLDGIDVQKLKSFASQAPFGLGRETLIDERVRKALEIKAERISLVQHSSDDGSER
jgi:hypothetical protein